MLITEKIKCLSLKDYACYISSKSKNGVHMSFINPTNASWGFFSQFTLGKYLGNTLCILGTLGKTFFLFMILHCQSDWDNILCIFGHNSRWLTVIWWSRGEPDTTNGSQWIVLTTLDFPYFPFLYWISIISSTNDLNFKMIAFITIINIHINIHNEFSYYSTLFNISCLNPLSPPPYL